MNKLIYITLFVLIMVMVVLIISNIIVGNASQTKLETKRVEEVFSQNYGWNPDGIKTWKVLYDENGNGYMYWGLE